MRRSKRCEVSFRPVEQGDLPLLAQWLARPHVERWWGDPAKAIASTERNLSDPAVDCFVMRLDGHDAGFLQSYDPHAWTGHPFADSPAGTRGLDMFIGEAGLVGRGYGSCATRQFVDHLFQVGVPEARIDPHPDNVAAIRAYEKAGFVAYAERPTLWGLALLMRRVNESRAT